MEEKKKKTEKKLCIMCECETNDFYKIPTNKGHVIKCADCYELWILRSTRQQSIQQIKNTQGE
jgi:hypothetical protein